MAKPGAKRRSKQWTLAKVRTKCHSAPAVWVALCDMHAERGTRSPVLTPTRKLLSELAGIRKHDMISQALTVLTRAGWIDLAHVPSSQNGNRTTLLRLILRRIPPKRVHTGGSAVSTQIGCNSKHPNRVHDFYSVKGGGTKKPSPPSLRSGTPSGRPKNAPPKNRHPEPEKEHPAEKIERERMTEIRKKRETEERAEQESRQPAGAQR